MNIIDKIIQNVAVKSGEQASTSGVSGFLNLLKMFGVSGQYSKKDLYVGLVYSCIDVLATSVSSAEFHLYRKNGKEKTIVDSNHPAFTLLQRPNQFQTSTDVLYLLSSMMDIQGKNFMYLNRVEGGDPREIWVCDPTSIELMFVNKLPAGFRSLSNRSEKYTTDEMLMIHRPNPFNQWEGLSTLEKARQESEGDMNASKWNAKFFENGGVPSGLISIDGAMTDKDRKELRDKYQESNAGLKNAHKPIVLGGGAKWQDIGLKQRDMSFVAQREMSEEKILKIFKTPKILLGGTDGINYATSITARQIYAEQVTAPRLKLLFEKLNRFYLPMFKGTEGMEFEFESPIPEDREFKLKYYQGAKWLSYNEIRVEEGREPIQDDKYDLPQGGNSNSGVDPLLALGAGDVKKKGTEEVVKKDYVPKTKAYYKNRRLQKAYQNKKEKYIVQNIKTMSKGLKPIFEDYIKSFKKKSLTYQNKSILTDGLSASQIFNFLMPKGDDFVKSLYTVISKNSQDAYVDGRENMKDTYNFKSDATLSHISAIALLDTRARNTADGVSKTINADVLNIIKDELAKDSSSIKSIREMLKTYLTDKEDYQVERIAKTELAYAYANGSRQEMYASGIVKQIQWLTESDACEECRMNDEEIVDLGGSFKSGDQDSPVHPNCRCSTVPYLPD